MSALLFTLVLVSQTADVRNTRHNLSAPMVGNTVRAQSETQVCVFCHVPHAASQSRAIWNRDLGYQAGASCAKLGQLPSACGRPLKLSASSAACAGGPSLSS